MSHESDAYEKVRAHILELLRSGEAMSLAGGRDDLKDQVSDPGHLDKAKRHAELWRMPRDWPPAMRACLAEIAASPKEELRVRLAAISTVGICGFRDYEDLLARMMSEVHVRIDELSCVARALSDLGSRKYLPLLWRVADYVHRYGSQDCALAIYRILFDENGRGPSTYIRDGLAWWERVRPTKQQVAEWASGVNLPPDDGFGNPSRKQA